MSVHHADPAIEPAVALEPPLTQRLNLGGRAAKVPVLLQTEAAECSLACLAMLAGSFGMNTDIASLRHRFSLSLKGVTLADMMRMAEQIGFSCRALRLEMVDLAQLPTPCVLHWNLNHFVVLTSVGPKHVEIHDPARGARRVSWEEASRCFTGVALTLAPSPRFKTGEARQSIRLREVFGQTRGLKRSLGIIFTLALVLELFALAGPIFNQLVVDQVLLSLDRELLTVLGLGFSLLLFTQLGISALRGWAVLYLSATFNVQWAASIFRHLTRLPLAWFEKRHLGDISSRFRSLNTIEKALTSQVVEILLDGLMSVGALLMILLYAPALAGIALAALVAYGAFRSVHYARLRRASESQIVFAAKADSFFLETLRGMQTIRLMNATAERAARWLNMEVDQRNAGLSVAKIELSSRIANALVFGVEGIALLWVGALMVMDNRLSMGMLFAALAFKDQFSTRASNLINQFIALKMLRLQAERLADIVLNDTEDDRSHHQIEVDALDPVLEMVNVSFRYADNEPWLLHQCSLRIEPGESIALTGASGSGKTTLMKILLGLLQPLEGEVRYGGVNINKLGLGEYRRRIAAVLQNDELFAGSIAENICFFSTEPQQMKIQAAARAAAVAGDIEGMPMGYHTLVGDMGTCLSGGQKQRLLIARAIHRDPRILFMDEATSHLDTANEAAINTVLSGLPMTRFMIAHRPSTVKAARRRLHLHEGQVVEMQTQHQLLQSALA
jgi:ATP-binding cassette subfamily B protein RaxB